MLTQNFRWSHAAGNQVVPSPWQATSDSHVVLALRVDDVSSTWWLLEATGIRDLRDSAVGRL